MSNKHAALLDEIAKTLDITPGEWISQLVEQGIESYFQADVDQEFAGIAQDIIDENRSLLKRLAE
jgi:hypothetical protein